MTPEESTLAAVRGMISEAEEKRNDPEAAFRFFMRDDQGAEVKALPHQLLGLHFAMHHPQCVLRWAIDTGKTTIARFIALYLLGHDPTERVLFASKTEDIAKKSVGVCRDYLGTEVGARMRLMFPHMQRSPRPTDPWTSTEITVQRPPGIADASMRAIGLDVSTQGAKVTTIVADDLLDYDNTRTKASRKEVSEKFNKRILNRLLPVPQARCVVINVPWDREDLTYELEKDRGWPTLTMPISGNVRIENAADDYDTEAVRPSRRREHVYYRIAAHDPDPEEEQTLDPVRYPQAVVEAMRAKTLPHVWAAQRECNPRSSTDARCSEEWVQAARERGRGVRMPADLEELADELGYRPPVFLGVDCGIGEDEGDDRSCIFAFCILPDELRRIVQVDAGRWQGPDLLDRVIEAVDRWHALAAVESNQAQKWLLQFGRRLRKNLRVRAHFTTKANKHARDFGVEGVFWELQQGLWVAPSSRNLVSPPGVHDALESCLDYRPPPAHTPDELMAWWIALEQARRLGYGRSGGVVRARKGSATRSPVREGGTF